MRSLFDSKGLVAHWNHAQIRHLTTPALLGYPCEPAHVRMLIKTLGRPQLQFLAESLWHLVAASSDRMLSKKDVARHVGMTVSWLDNSDSEKARKLRNCGVRYGKSQTSPVRYPLLRVLQICKENEAPGP